MKTCRNCCQLMNEWRERCPYCRSWNPTPDTGSKFRTVIAVGLAVALLAIGVMML